MSLCKLNYICFQKVLYCKAKILSSHTRFYTSKYGKLFAERLKDKCLIELKGKDSSSLLQGLITNDINHLTSDSKAIYSMVLNSRGRVMLDTIVAKGQDDNTFLLECDSFSVHILEKHIKKYKLRKKVALRVLENDFCVYAVFNVKNIIDSLPKKLISHIIEDTTLKFILDDNKSDICLEDFNFGDFLAYPDPRLAALGYRVVVPKSSLFKDVSLNDPGDVELYKLCRYWLGIAEGKDELPYEQCFPLESNCDYMHGISFHKGCYLGQELTARSHHTGVIRKRHMPLLLATEPTDILPIDIRADDSETAKKVGKLRGYYGRYGVALLRTADCLKLNHLHIGSVTAQCFKPIWWPMESPKLIKQEVT